jgi:hypothetical protein
LVSGVFVGSNSRLCLFLFFEIGFFNLTFATFEKMRKFIYLSSTSNYWTKIILSILSGHDEGYSRNASGAVNLISRFLLLFWYICYLWGTHVFWLASLPFKYNYFRPVITCTRQINKFSHLFKCCERQIKESNLKKQKQTKKPIRRRVFLISNICTKIVIKT